MATTIQIKRSSTASGVPLATDLAVGELAVNLADKRLFTKQSDGTIIELSTNPTDLDAATLRIDGVEITASATELNKLDGFTGSTAELNLLDGLTATTIELNTLDGITASTAELNKLDGYTGSTAELNILDGVTATTAEINTLDGITATTTELNYTDGVTSNIQTQLDGKATTAQGALADSAVQPNDNVTFGTGDFTGSVDVTGTVTADGLTSNGDITVDTENAELKLIDTSSGNTTSILSNNFDTSISADGRLFLRSGGASNAVQIASNGNVSFYEDTGTTAKMVWDASEERLGIGTSSPSAPLHVHNSATPTTSLSEGLTLSSNVAGVDNRLPAITWDYGITGTPSFAAIDVSRAANTGGNLLFHTSNDSGNLVARMRIDSSGNVGIGTNSPIAKLTVDGQVRASGTAGYGFNSPGDTDGGMFSPSDGVVSFKTNGTERARIDSQGTVLVGKTNADIAVAGHKIEAIGRTWSSVDGGYVSGFNRLTSDGDIVQFRKDGSTVGSIGSHGADVYVGTSDTGIRFNSASNSVTPYNPSSGANRSDAIDLGFSAIRYKDLYLSGGVYLGGTGAANKLDDYETGTWTPVLTDGTTSYTLANGTYTKVGSLITVTVSATLTTSTTATTGTAYISGLPYAVASGNNSAVGNYHTRESILGYDVLTDGNIVPRATAGSSVIDLIAIGSVNDYQRNIPLNDLVNTSGTASNYFTITITYRTA